MASNSNFLEDSVDADTADYDSSCEMDYQGNKSIIPYSFSLFFNLYLTSYSY